MNTIIQIIAGTRGLRSRFILDFLSKLRKKLARLELISRVFICCLSMRSLKSTGRGMLKLDCLGQKFR